MDYGHELEFGAFLTPDASGVEQVLENSQLADVLGLDLVTVQDHPYAAQQVEMWTLLSVIGARTTAVRLCPNVASLPLRPPVVLAKAVATLDRITGGRAELGLGAGAFWDGIAAAGGPRRTPKEAVDALIEAIGVIRAFWAGGSVRVEGVHYPVRGLKAGPVPAHDIPIWLGAYKPRMLRVTGRLADVWIPSMGYADPPALAEMNARIDAAATAAGRASQAVRRGYNVMGSFGQSGEFLRGSARDWAEQLAELTLRDGMATYVLGSDDPRQLAAFAQEVAPAVRELVADERARRSANPVAAVGHDDGDALPGGHDDPNAHAGPASADAPPAPPGSSARGVGEPIRGETAGGDRIATSGGRQGSARHTLLRARATPDDGRRRAAEEAWDEGERAAYEMPEREWTAHEEAVAQHLVDVHDHLRSELTQVRDVVEQVRHGQLGVGSARSVIQTMSLRQNNWTLGAYCAAYCRVVTGHHTLEDRSVFPHLRRAEPGLAPVIERLEAEHHIIADLLDRLDAALVALVTRDGSADSLDALGSALDLLTDALLSHLSYEERQLLVPLAAHGFG